jgi:hypothetical protein
MRGQTPRTTELCNPTEEDVSIPCQALRAAYPQRNSSCERKVRKHSCFLVAGDQCDIFPNQKILQDVSGSVVGRYSNWVKEPHVRRNHLFYGSVDTQRRK